MTEHDELIKLLEDSFYQETELNGSVLKTFT